MEVKVSENLQSYYLAMRKNDGTPYWVKAVGHIVTVGAYQFGVAGIPDEKGDFQLNISEVTTGIRVKILKNDPSITLMTSTKETTIILYETLVAEHLKRIIELPIFESELAKFKAITEKEYGPMPESEEIDYSFITEPISKNPN